MNIKPFSAVVIGALVALLLFPSKSQTKNDTEFHVDTNELTYFATANFAQITQYYSYVFMNAGETLWTFDRIDRNGTWGVTNVMMITDYRPVVTKRNGKWEIRFLDKRTTTPKGQPK